MNIAFEFMMGKFMPTTNLVTGPINVFIGNIVDDLCIPVNNFFFAMTFLNVIFAANSKKLKSKSYI